MYIFLAKIATKQYKIGTPIITEKCLSCKGTKPIAFPKKVYGTIIATILNNIVEK